MKFDVHVYLFSLSRQSPASFLEEEIWLHASPRVDLARKYATISCDEVTSAARIGAGG